ncbi:unnamed protein product [Nyctereutes procyonoides]|uniref:(raccoon dog) hypothetical protein n=1 Tax=Nyctereutes procyonoides TaxID=34880 RepID=A0A811YVU2_NYCPR|nr:unnamed protein product [Nyctereutes procyonoides]CAD7688191.1 unnamed protein product [Nyctereutes procyonoides]
MQEAGFQATNAFTECKFTCTSGKCLYLGSLVCNQQNDCGDNSDEENCLLVTEHPPPGIFNCKSLLLTSCQEGRLWPSDSSRPRPSASEVMYAPRPRDRFAAPAFLPRDRFSRFQPTYPYVQHDIDLPPTISLSDGEEPPPYQGPCALQLRDPEQQRELNRESVRAPPNRTIFDSDLLDVAACSAGPCPPSSHSGISASTCSSHGRMEGPPPAYSEVIGRPPGAALLRPQHGALRGGGPVAPQDSVGGPALPAQAKDRKPGNLA